MAEQQDRRIVSLRDELREAREKLQKNRDFRKALGAALDDAGNPVRIAAEDSAGMLLGGALAAGVSYALDAATIKKGEERQKGQPRKPNLWSGIVKTALGGVGWSLNVALPYKFPMSPIRGAARSMTNVTTAFGLAELAQTGLLWWERRSIEKALKDKLALEQAAQERAAQIAGSQQPAGAKK